MINRGLIVSCQAEEGSPFNNPFSISAFAQAAEIGGAVAVRIRDVDNIKTVHQAISLPIIGLTKTAYPDGGVLITPTVEDGLELQAQGADIIAVDASWRRRLQYKEEIVKLMKAAGIKNILADIATIGDAEKAENAGADLVATTLSGSLDYILIEELVRTLSIPVIAEGHIWTPEQARRAFDCGVHAVVVGSAITRPIEIIKRFIGGLNDNSPG